MRAVSDTRSTAQTWRRSTAIMMLLAALAEYRAGWAPVWAALEALRLAHDGWATALRAGRADAALPAVREAYCDVWRATQGRVELPAMGCTR